MMRIQSAIRNLQSVPPPAWGCRPFDFAQGGILSEIEGCRRQPASPPTSDPVQRSPVPPPFSPPEARFGASEPPARWAGRKVVGGKQVVRMIPPPAGRPEAGCCHHDLPLVTAPVSPPSLLNTSDGETQQGVG